ncbi:MAG: hypothetical protein IIY21_01940, partial [Clostridiales bacterium]|nr:hypothetical protein [Clostridiales bacterium]
MTSTSKFEKALATASFCAAVFLAVTSMYISEDNDIAAGVLMAVAQFLLLTASILHIDYKLNLSGQAGKDKRTEG